MDTAEMKLVAEFIEGFSRIAAALERIAETNDKILAHHEELEANDGESEG